MDATHNLAKNLRALRTLQGSSLVSFAKALNISKSTLQEIEHGRPPHLDTVECIAQSLDIPVAALLSDAFPSNEGKLPIHLLKKLGWCATWEAEDREKLLRLCEEIVCLLNKYRR